MKSTVSFIKPYAFWVSLCVSLKILGALSELALPRVLAVITDYSVPAGDMSSVITYGVIMIFLAILAFLFNLFGNRLSGVTSGKVAYDIRKALFEKTLYIDSADADRLGTASLTSRLTSDTYNVTHFFTRLQRVGLKSPIMLLGGVVMTLTIDWRLALILVLVLPLVSFVVYKVTKKAVPVYEREQQILDLMVKKVDESAAGIRVIKALSKGEYESERFHEISEGLVEKELEAGRLMSLTKPLTDLLLNFGFCLVILLGAILSYFQGYSASGALLAFMTYFTLILNSTVLLTRIFVQMSKSVASAKRIEEVLNLENKLLIEEKGEKRENTGYISFKDVSFSYNKKRLNLENISFSIEKGQALGIIGATGSGKSTLVNLLLRLYDADTGEIRIDGRNIREIPREELSTLFGVALQNDFIFKGTVEENVAFFREGDIDGALEASQAGEFVSELRDGINAPLTTRGTNVSGGQKQRLLIARALYTKPEILILDDSSSALDFKTDKKLRLALARWKNTTKIIISQRISTVKAADLILVLDEGRLIASGSHKELMERSSLYRDIAMLQMGEGGDLI